MPGSGSTNPTAPAKTGDDAPRVYGVREPTERIWLPKSSEARAARQPSESQRPSRALAGIHRFLRKHQTFLVIVGAILLIVVPLSMGAFSGGGQTRRKKAVPRPVKPALAKEAGTESTEGGEAGPQVVTVSEPEEKHGFGTSGQRDDAALELLLALEEQDYEDPEQVATGRFLKEMDQKVEFLKGIDLKTLRALSQGVGWTRLEAIYRPSRYWFERKEDGEEEEKTVILELIREEALWKIEYLKVLAKRGKK